MNASLPWIALALAACHPAPPTAPAAPTEGQLPGDGTSLYYRTTGGGPDVLVMIHGGPGMDSGYMIPDFGPLAAHHRLVFYDQRGSGRSELLRDDPALFGSAVTWVFAAVAVIAVGTVLAGISMPRADDAHRT